MHAKNCVHNMLTMAYYTYTHMPYTCSHLIALQLNVYTYMHLFPILDETWNSSMTVVSTIGLLSYSINVITKGHGGLPSSHMHTSSRASYT
jgi:hypothetical protein